MDEYCQYIIRKASIQHCDDKSHEKSYKKPGFGPILPFWSLFPVFRLLYGNLCEIISQMDEMCIEHFIHFCTL